MTDGAAPRWRPMRADDLVTVKALSDRVHAGLPERAEVLAEKFSLFPAGAFVLARADACVGYALAHAWRLDSVPALDTLLGALPAEADCLYLHDVAILADARGHGAARVLVDQLVAVAQAHGLRMLALTSVYGTDVFWATCGFVERALPDMDAEFASYGGPARYMTRSL